MYHTYFFRKSLHFVFHDASGVELEVRVALELWIWVGWAMLQNIKAQAEFDGLLL